MHLADGVLSVPVALVSSAAAVGLLVYGAKGVKEEHIPRISLLAGAFFVSSMISIPVGPASVHPALGGLIGLMLGRSAPLAVFVGLLLQALLFQHGGLTTLGANTLMMSLPALAVAALAGKLRKLPMLFKGMLCGSLAVAGGLLILVLLLWTTDPLYGQGTFSVIPVLVLVHLPLIGLEGVLTGFVARFLDKVRPGMIQTGGGNRSG